MCLSYQDDEIKRVKKVLTVYKIVARVGDGGFKSRLDRSGRSLQKGHSKSHGKRLRYDIGTTVESPKPETAGIYVYLTRKVARDAMPMWPSSQWGETYALIKLTVPRGAKIQRDGWDLATVSKVKVIEEVKI